MTDLLLQIRLLGVEPIDTLMDPNLKLSASDSVLLEDLGQYRRLVDKLYILLTHPNIFFVVRVVSQYIQSPRKSHLDEVLRILQCFKRAPCQLLLFGCN